MFVHNYFKLTLFLETMDYVTNFKLTKYTAIMVRQRLTKLNATLPLEEKIVLVNQQMWCGAKLSTNVVADLSIFLRYDYVHKILAILFLLPIFVRPVKNKYQLNCQMKHVIESYLNSVNDGAFYYHDELPCKLLMGSPIFPQEALLDYNYICRESIVLAFMIHGFAYKFTTFEETGRNYFYFKAEPIKRITKEMAFNFLLEYQLPLPTTFTKSITRKFTVLRKRRQNCQRIYMAMLCQPIRLPIELWRMIADYVFCF